MTSSGTDVARSVEAAVGAAGSVDWSDPRGALPVVSRVFDRILAEPGLLAAAIREVVDARGGLGGCESYPCMDKLLLWQSADRSVRLRLHLFSPGYVDRPHNHRWSFLSRVLAGSYLHSLYGGEDEVLAAAGRGQPPQAGYVHEVGAGAQYLLDHRLVHSLSAAEPTVSLVLRGPAVKPDYFTLDGGPGEVRWSTGAARESVEERNDKALTEPGFDRVVGELDRLGVL